MDVLKYKIKSNQKLNNGQKFILISVSSAGFKAGNFATISINNIPIIVNSNENGHFRGLHIIMINKQNGKILYAQCFDTY